MDSKTIEEKLSQLMPRGLSDEGQEQCHRSLDRLATEAVNGSSLFQRESVWQKWSGWAAAACFAFLSIVIWKSNNGSSPGTQETQEEYELVHARVHASGDEEKTYHHSASGYTVMLHEQVNEGGVMEF